MWAFEAKLSTWLSSDSKSLSSFHCAPVVTFHRLAGYIFAIPRSGVLVQTITILSEVLNRIPKPNFRSTRRIFWRSHYAHRLWSSVQASWIAQTILILEAYDFEHCRNRMFSKWCGPIVSHIGASISIGTEESIGMEVDDCHDARSHLPAIDPHPWSLCLNLFTKETFPYYHAQLTRSSSFAGTIQW